MNGQDAQPATIDLRRVDAALSKIISGLSALQAVVQEALSGDTNSVSDRQKGVTEAIAALKAKDITAVTEAHIQHSERYRLFCNRQKLDPQEPSTAELFDLLAAAPVSLLTVGKRARDMFENLAVQTLLDLVIKTGDELIETKNFGVTSVNEVRWHLQKLGLKLAGE